MKTLSDPEARTEILERLQRVTPDCRRRWGRMNAHQMVCHLADSIRGVMGDVHVSPGPGPLPRGILKFVALKMPLKWPHGIRTRPEVDQEDGGTRPTQFAADLAALEILCGRFVGNPEAILPEHPILGPMSQTDWMRWGYLHIDHHLRQFGR
ncbi:MAG: hypothetical protein WCC21_20520 [Candidatus Acidiferrales bacterium]